KQVDIDIPELRHDIHWLDMSSGQRKSYDHAEATGITGIRDMKGEATRIHILALITKLKLICNYDDESGQSCKLEFLADRVDEIVDSGEKALVFSQYPQKTVPKIETEMRSFNPLRFDGSLSTGERDRVVEQFQDEDENDLLLMSVRAGGVGITLTRANHVFHFDHWWNPAVIDQASARVHRIGQKRAVFIHSLYTVGTIEERIANLLEGKRQLFEEMFGDMTDKDVSGKLTDEDLFGLFGLEPPKQTEKDNTP
ncbi:MAG: SWF/SNF helicase family protein, partial [Dehalococcoidia bacterium]|nr:SWF/SNF helicase family protein [Dehalococcoidia bacterium]